MEKDSHKLNNQCKTQMQTKIDSPSDSNKNKAVYMWIIVILES